MRDGDYFTVEEAASIMGCRRRKVYDLIADGWLFRPPGKTKQESGGKVTKKSLYQFVIVDRLSHLSVRILRKLKNDRKVFEKSECKKAEANRISIDERGDIAHPSPDPLPQGEGEHNGEPNGPSTEAKRCRHHDFAERHQYSFGWRARQLARGDGSLQDDLVQEMSVAVLEYDQAADFDFLFGRAASRAIDYLRYEAARGTMSLSAARLSDRAVARMASLNDFIEELEQRGVPREWIEEVINWRLAA